MRIGIWYGKNAGSTRSKRGRLRGAATGGDKVPYLLPRTVPNSEGKFIDTGLP